MDDRAHVLLVQENVLSPEECLNIVARIQTNSDALSPEHRRTVQVITNKAVAQMMFDRIRGLLPTQLPIVDSTTGQQSLGQLIGVLPAMKIIVQTEEAPTGPFHEDWDPSEHIGPIRLLTALFYLTDTFEGGATRFRFNTGREQWRDVFPRVGKVCIFDQRLAHRAEQLKGNAKMILRLTIAYEPVAIPTATPSIATTSSAAIPATTLTHLIESREPADLRVLAQMYIDQQVPSGLLTKGFFSLASLGTSNTPSDGCLLLEAVMATPEFRHSEFLLLLGETIWKMMDAPDKLSRATAVRAAFFGTLTTDLWHDRFQVILSREKSGKVRRALLQGLLGTLLEIGCEQHGPTLLRRLLLELCSLSFLSRIPLSCAETIRLQARKTCLPALYDLLKLDYIGVEEGALANLLIHMIRFDC